MSTKPRVPLSDGIWRDINDLSLEEIREEMDELLAEVTGLVRTRRPPEE
ncbi:MAG TPA: hypothetical protein VN886_08860 [Acidimicrobiales bacterium]|nr:hypothetical protein [Acidimicrobiales bacterium]